MIQKFEKTQTLYFMFGLGFRKTVFTIVIESLFWNAILNETIRNFAGLMHRKRNMINLVIIKCTVSLSQTNLVFHLKCQSLLNICVSHNNT